jgi:predicted nucleic acid-binding protein
VSALGNEADQAAVAWLAAAEEGRVRALAPDLVYVEVASALLGYLRTGAITTAQADERLTHVIAAPLSTIPLGLLARQALALAVLRRLSPYDACYLALAIGYDAVLVTADRRLAQASEKAALLPRDFPPGS